MKKLTFAFLLTLSHFSFGQSDSLELAQVLDLVINDKSAEALKSVKVIHDKRHSVESYLYYAEALWGMKKYKEAIEMNMQAREEFAESSDLFNQFGMFLTMVDMNDEAVLAFTDALELATNDDQRLSLYMNRGASYCQIRNFQEGNRDFQKAFSMDTTNVSVMTNLSVTYSELGKTKEGIEILKKALQYELTPFDKVGILANLGFLNQELGEHAIAIDYYNQVLGIDPKEALGYSNRSFNFMMVGELEKAMIDIDKSIDLYPENDYAYMVKGKIYLKQGKTKQACKQFEMALERNFTLHHGDEVEKLMRENCN